MSNTNRKIYYLPHGGGPMPLMGDPGHTDIVRMMQGLNDAVGQADAIVVVTAHWEEDVATFSGGGTPGLIFDYAGFPPETYSYVYPAPGAPELAARAEALLADAGIASRIDVERGYDHGTFVPMMLIRPDADRPVLQVSLLASLDPAAHIAYGRALAPLLDENIAIIGSGLSFHNLRALLPGADVLQDADAAFDGWLHETLMDPALSDQMREQRLIAWNAAPGARTCHPREEHLLPLHVCFGAASAAGLAASSIFNERFMGCMTSGFAWTD